MTAHPEGDPRTPHLVDARAAVTTRPQAPLFASLFARLAVLLFLLFGAFAVVQALAGLWIAAMQRHELDQRLNRELAEHLVAETTILDRGEIQSSNLEHIFHMLMVINPRIEVYLLDPRGKILAYSAPEGHVRRDRVALEPITELLAESERMPIFGDDPRDPSGRKVFSVATIGDPDSPEGFLYVVLSGEGYDSVADRLRASYFLRLGVWTAPASAAIALLCGLLVVRLLTRRLAQLDLKMQAFATETLKDGSGDGVWDDSSSAAAARWGGDEVARLELSFRRMADRIRSQMEELRSVDRLRRELVANVSHDLRTPLAALQGYLETLTLKHETLAGEERREYVEIALRHAERLGRLVADLFDLATLEAGQAEVRMEPFNAAELAQDVVQKYRLSAEEAGIALDAVLPQNLAFVRGDIGLVERAVENLLQNAIRHTPEGGTITVRLASSDSGIEMRVEDTGCGIAPECLPRIFDRFYRASNDPGEGAGLGLAITRRIVELHGSQITVDSRPEVGTTFCFTLPWA